MKRTDIGGQAVIEGVMMRSEKGTALVVRRSDGSLAKEFHHKRTRYKKGSFPTWPVVRGVYAFFKALSDGMNITTRAAEMLGEEEEPVLIPQLDVVPKNDYRRHQNSQEDDDGK